VTCSARGRLRYRASTTTATVALVASSYFLILGAAADPAPGENNNDARKVIKLAQLRPAVQIDSADDQANAQNPAAPAKKKAVDAPANTVDGARKKAADATAAPVQGAQTNATGKGDLIRSIKTANTTEDPAQDAVPAPGPAPGTQSNAAGKGDLFRSGPQYDRNYETQAQVDIYGAKKAVEPPRPIEVGRQQYTAGEYAPSNTIFGALNPLLPGLSIYGDWRTAVAYNSNAGADIAQVATRLNIDVDLKITGTERIHAFFTPIQNAAKFTRCEFAGGAADGKCTFEFDPLPQTLFFEGDFGSIYSGISGTAASFDLPFTAGLFPLFLQNGIWANDNILGGAVSITAKNSRRLGLANFDVTFFSAFENVDNAIVGAANKNDVNLYGATAFIDAFGGYLEGGYGLIQGKNELEGQFTNYLTAAFSKRYFNTITNSTRVFANFGNAKNDEGFAIISENSIITSLPSTLLPYANFFIGIGNPVPLVDGNNAGILKNVGINFETDALTGFPKLDDTGFDAYGGALGLQYLFNLDQQLVFEVAAVQPLKSGVGAGGIQDTQYGFGVRYQIALDKSWLFRADATYQILAGGEDNFGVRSEIRKKF
jgi:hypothetical protein